MTTKKQSPESKLISQMKRKSLKEFRHSIALLKKAGIINKRVDARSLKPTPHYKKIIKQFSDVITGKVKAVKAPKYCPTQGCKTIKANRKTILLIDVSDKKNPHIRITKQGVSVVDRFYGKSAMELVISKKAGALINLTEDEIDALESKYSLSQNQSFVFTIEEKKHGKSYISKVSFQSLNKLIAYMSNYSSGSTSVNFADVTVSIRVLGDADISDYQNKQSEETRKARNARNAAYKKAKRSKAVRNIM